MNPPAPPSASSTYGLLGTPNAGKTTLFNALCGVRARTANFPGSTVSARVGRATIEGGHVDVVDLPGCYGLNLDRPESKLCRAALDERVESLPKLDALLVVVDANDLARNLVFANQAVQQDRPVLVAVTRLDLAERKGITVDLTRLAERLGCPVVGVSALKGEGVPTLRRELARPRRLAHELASPVDAEAAALWANAVAEECVTEAPRAELTTDRLDVVLTHPIVGTLIFVGLMMAVFYVIFAFAELPMTGIEWVFGRLGDSVTALLPPGPIHDLLVNGIIGGVAGTVVFLPQICLLFFLLSLLEESGYLARAAFVTDRWLRPLGLPGQAFVPLLSAHACAIPAIMAARLVPDRRDRLATILVAPFMSCAARLPVYVLLIGILFRGRPLAAGLAFAGCFALGALAALLSAALARRTILPGRSAHMILELPPYACPSVGTALRVTADRGWMFLRKAGTVIVCICVILWWLGAYPTTSPPAPAVSLMAQAEALVETAPEQAAELQSEADRLTARHAMAQSAMGRLGRVTEPVLAPLGYDWQLSVGVLSSFLAREVFVTTMAIVIAGDDTDPAEDDGLRERLEGAQRDDGGLVFTLPTAASLLVFYVLAMQCLPTLEVTRRETGSWRWAALQLVWMTTLAYVLAFVTYRIALGIVG